MLNTLERIDVFQGLTPAERQTLEPYCLRREFREGQRLFRGEEDAPCLWAVKSGRIDLRFELPAGHELKNVTIARVTEGQAFGWSSLVPPHHYHLSAYCGSERSEVVTIDAKDMVAVFEKEPRIGYVVMSNIARMVGTRFRQLEQELVLKEGREIVHRADN